MSTNIFKKHNINGVKKNSNSFKFIKNDFIGICGG